MWTVNFMFWNTWVGRVRPLHANKIRTIRLKADARVIYIQRD